MVRCTRWLVVLAACSAVHSDDKLPAAAEPRDTKAQPAPAPPSCVDDGRPFDEEAMRARLAAFAAPELAGRKSGTAGDAAARALIAARFQCLGLAPAGAGFEQAFTDAEGNATANVVGLIAGRERPDEIILVGAHHDHLGGAHLGANDNGSGVVGLLAVAQAVAQLETKPARTIAFVTFGAEEQGLVGSQYFVAHPPSRVPLAGIVQYINLDMIGSHASKRHVAAFGAFPNLPATRVLARLARKVPEVHLGIGGHSVRGDQAGFCEHGIPYVFLWTPDTRCYHQTCDTADRIDYPRMAEIAQLASGLAVTLADSDLDLVAAKRKLGCFGR